jgi:hypothetical protein
MTPILTHIAAAMIGASLGAITMAIAADTKMERLP